MKAKDERTPPLCAYCIHAIFLSSEGNEALPFPLTLKADPQRDDTPLRCPYRKEITADFSCRRFTFDPLKYRPRAAASPVLLDEEALLLD